MAWRAPLDARFTCERGGQVPAYRAVSRQIAPV